MQEQASAEAWLALEAELEAARGPVGVRAVAGRGAATGPGTAGEREAAAHQSQVGVATCTKAHKGHAQYGTA